MRRLPSPNGGYAGGEYDVDSGIGAIPTWKLMPGCKELVNFYEFSGLVAIGDLHNEILVITNSDVEYN